ncbi:MAG: hypothetical protein QM703_27645 [Gemmatales bacterium]
MSTKFALGGLLLLGATLLFVPLQPPWPKTLEAGLYLLGLVLLASYAPVRQLFDGLPRSQRWGLLGLTAILLVAQIRDRSQQTFPFLTWNMYHARFPNPPAFLEYQGICADGREVFLPIGDVFASQHRTVTWRLFNLWNLMEAEQDETTRTELTRQFHALLGRSPGGSMNSTPKHA